MAPQPPTPLPFPSSPTSIVNQSPHSFEEAEKPFEEQATKFLLKKLRDHSEETPDFKRKD